MQQFCSQLWRIERSITMRSVCRVAMLEPPQYQNQIRIRFNSDQNQIRITSSQQVASVVRLYHQQSCQQ